MNMHSTQHTLSERSAGLVTEGHSTVTCQFLRTGTSTYSIAEREAASELHVAACTCVTLETWDVVRSGILYY